MTAAPAVAVDASAPSHPGAAAPPASPGALDRSAPRPLRFPAMSGAEMASRNRIATPRRRLPLPGNETFSLMRLETAGQSRPPSSTERVAIELSIGGEALTARAGRGFVWDLLRPLGDIPASPMPPADLAALLLEAALLPLIELLERGLGAAVAVERLALDRETAPPPTPDADDVTISLDGPGLRHLLRLSGPVEALDRLFWSWPAVPRDVGAVPFAVGFEIGATTLPAGTIRSLRPGDAILLQETPAPRGGADEEASAAASRVVVRVAEALRAAAERRGSGIRLLEPFRAAAADRDTVMSEQDDPDASAEDAAVAGAAALFDALPVRLVFEAGRIELTLAELAALGVGAVIETRTAPGRVDIRANGRRIGWGELVTVDGRAAVRLLALDTAASAEGGGER